MCDMNVKSFFICFFLLSFALFSCKKNDNTINTNGVPYVRVNQTIYGSDPVMSKINAVGGWVYIAGGSKGIILYHKSIDSYVALDRHSTYNVAQGCVVQVDKTDIMAVDTCSGSEFLISDGIPTKGPATLPLTQYQTRLDGGNLVIFN